MYNRPEHKTRVFFFFYEIRKKKNHNNNTIRLSIDRKTLLWETVFYFFFFCFVRARFDSVQLHGRWIKIEIANGDRRCSDRISVIRKVSSLEIFQMEKKKNARRRRLERITAVI